MSCRYNQGMKNKIWYLFTGMDGPWTTLYKTLTTLPIFANKVEECHQTIVEFGMDLKYLLETEDMSTMAAKFCAITSIQIGFFEVLKAHNQSPDGIIGHSFGEIACAYADGCLTTREAMIVSFLCGRITESDENVIKGSMLLCALTKSEALRIIPPEVVIACYTANNTVVLSGPEKQIKGISQNLKQNNIFTHHLESKGIPYHSPYLRGCAQTLTEELRKYLPNPKKRSKKWVSTSLWTQTEDNVFSYASAEYFANNLVSPVYIYDKFIEIPPGVIIIEIGPHGHFRKILDVNITGQK